MIINRFSVLVLLAFISMPANSASCPDVYSHAADTYNQAEQGHNSDNLADARSYAMKSMSAAVDTIWATESCGCGNVDKSITDAYNFARKAYWSADFQDAIDYLGKAKSFADDAMSMASHCAS